MNTKMTQSEVNEKIYDHRVLPDWSNATKMHYSKDMIFNDGHRLSIAVYSLLFVISTIANSTVLYLLLKRRFGGPIRPSRIDIMLMHLAIADLMVTFLLMPLEIAWAWTVQWKSTDFVCRLMSFFRVFGLYLSSFVLVCISVDRYYAILKPMRFPINRGRLMLAGAWVMSVICSSPQAFLFHVEEHPAVKGYYQCVTFHSFPSTTHDMIYNIANMCTMYAFPLITFIFCYGAIYLEIYRKSKRVLKGVERFRRSNDDVMSRAKKRTLKMTITIVIVFIICWTPYYIICMWYWIDVSSVDKVSSLVRKGLFIFASTNSCMNPIVYGAFNICGSFRNNTASNRHTSLSYRRESSRQFHKNLHNVNGKFLRTDSVDSKGLSEAISNAPAVAIRITASSGETTDGVVNSNGVGDGCTLVSNDVVKTKMIHLELTTAENAPEKTPMICINCSGDSIEIANLQKP